MATRNEPVRIGDHFINTRSGETLRVIESKPCGHRTLVVVGKARFVGTYVAQIRLSLAAGTMARVG